MHHPAFLPLLLTVILSLSACNSVGGIVTESESETSETSQIQSVESSSDSSEMFTDRDVEIGYDEETSARITLSGNSASSDSDAVQISGSTVTIKEEGTYILSGTLNDGMIVVGAEDTDKIQLVLDNVEITNSTSAAIYVLEADKVFITTASGSENTLANGGEYVAIDENNIDAVIFSKSDLTLNGAGTLTINAAAGHGVVSKDDLLLTSGTYEITAASQGLSGKDSVRIANGTYTISSGKDGIHAENTDDTSLGFLYISGGTFIITADGDGISASAYLQIENGSFTITTGEGSASVTMTTDIMNLGQQGGFQGQTTTTEDDTASQKGIKADGAITITGGTFVTDTVDDSIHSNSDILITSGQFDLRTGDDGINSAGGTDSSGFGGARPGQEQFASSSDSFITINGGDFVIVSTGDCVDSNGTLTINNGTLDLTCNGSGNTAIDCDGTYTNNGGDVTTNDGSENNLGQMGGQGGMGQGRGGH